MWNNKRVSVVLPAYNEAKNIRSAVQEFLAIPVVDEVVVVDNNSKDETARLACEAGARVVAEKRQGFGFALQRGMAEVHGDLIVLCEPDDTFQARDLYKLVSYSEDFDMVLGTRTTQQLIWQGANMGPALRLGNLFVAKLLELLFGGPSLSDCGCTFRLLTRSAYVNVRPHLTVGGSHFLPEMVVQGLLRKQRVIEIPVNYRGRVGVSKITGSFGKTLLTGGSMILLILLVRCRTLMPPSLKAQVVR